LTTNTDFLSDEQYNELIKIQYTRINQGFLKCVVSPSVKIKSVFALKITFHALQNVIFLQHVIISK
jgi:hypothetical protein